MRALLRLHPAVVGRISRHGSGQAFGGLLPHQNRHFVRENVRWSSTMAGKHKADLVLDANFEPTTYPTGCDKDEYRGYFKRSKVFIPGYPLESRPEDVSETTRGLRPDAVVLPEKPPSAARLKDLSPEKVDLLWPKELALAYKEAKALPNCAVICDDTALSRTHKRGLLEKLKKRADAEKRLKEPKENERVSASRPVEDSISLADKLFLWGLGVFTRMWLLYTIYVPSEKNKRFQEVEKSARMLTSAMKRSVALEQKAQRIYVAYVLQRTLNERAIEKYQRLQASEKDKLEPVRIVSLMYFDDLEDTEENWRRPIDKERAEELLKQESQPTPSGSRRDWIVTGMALFYIVFMLASLEELVSGTAINTLKKRTDRETQ